MASSLKPDKLTVMCAKCKREVDRVIRERNHYRAIENFVAECHGQREFAIITDMDYAEGVTIISAVAFLDASTMRDVSNNVEHARIAKNQPLIEGPKQ